MKHPKPLRISLLAVLLSGCATDDPSLERGPQNTVAYNVRWKRASPAPRQKSTAGRTAVGSQVEQQWGKSNGVLAVRVQSRVECQHSILLPPFFRKCTGLRENSAKNSAHKSRMGDFYSAGALILWGFKLLVFDQLGFFSRINIRFC